jgi:putative DNA primase/helicase
MGASFTNDIDHVRRALLYIPAEDRETWVRMGMAIKSAFGEAGFELWDAWSRQADSYNAHDAQDVWKSFRADGQITLGTLFFKATAHGWRDDSTEVQISGEALEAHNPVAMFRVNQEEAVIAQDRAKAARWAADIWAKAAGAESDHPYLVRKQVSAVATLREMDASLAAEILGYTPKSGGEPLTGRLLVVPVKIGSKLSTLELIDVDSRKTALAGRGSKAGGYWAAQQLPEDDGEGMTLLIGEGVATVLSAKQACNALAVATLSSGNLPAVAKTVRERYPAATLILLADLVKTTGDPDAHAIEAAEACRGKVAVPDFGAARPNGATDFNDLFLVAGAEVVRRCIDAAKVPARKAIADTWPEPIPLPDALPPVQPFVPDLLPESLRPWVMDIADRMQCPPDFPAVGAIVAVSSLIGARAVVQPKAKDTWQVVPNMWGLVIGRPGVMKSPALSESLKPLHQLQTQEFELLQAAHKAWQIDAKLAELQGADNEKKAKGMASKDPAAARALLQPIELPEEPEARRFIVNDATVEKLGELLQANPRGILSYRDELYGLLTGMDKQGQEGARAFYLQAYDGNQGYTFDRIGRGTVHIERVCLAMVGGIQPGRIQEYVRGAVSGGSADDGLLQRFGLTVWPDVTKEFRHVDEWPDTPAKQAAWEVFYRLAKLGPASDSEPHIWRFDDAAQALFVEWLVPFESEIRGDELHPAMVSHLAKYRKLIPALALVFALIDTPDSGGVIGVKELRRALAWGDYLRSHANRLYAAAVLPETTGAALLLKKIRAGALGTEFTPRTAAQKCWAGLNTPDAVRKAADVLIDYGWLCRDVQMSGDLLGRGRPSERYQVNPASLAQGAGKAA